METIAMSIRWATGHLVEPEVADEMLGLISELIQEANNQQQQPGKFAHQIEQLFKLLFNM